MVGNPAARDQPATTTPGRRPARPFNGDAGSTGGASHTLADPG